MNFFQKFSDFVSRPSHSRTMGILAILVLVSAVSLTVIASQQRQQIRQRADNSSCTTGVNSCVDGAGIHTNSCNGTSGYTTWSCAIVDPVTGETSCVWNPVTCDSGQVCEIDATTINPYCGTAPASTPDTCTTNGGSCISMGPCVPPAQQNTSYNCGNNPNGSVCCIPPLPPASTPSCTTGVNSCVDGAGIHTNSCNGTSGYTTWSCAIVDPVTGETSCVWNPVTCDSGQVCDTDPITQLPYCGTAPTPTPTPISSECASPKVCTNSSTVNCNGTCTFLGENGEVSGLCCDLPPVPTSTPTITATPTPTNIAGDTIIGLPAGAFNTLFTNKRGEPIARKDQSLTMYLYNQTDNPSTSDSKGAHPIAKSTPSNKLLFSGGNSLSFNLGKVPAGTYKILLKSPKYLRALVADNQTVKGTGETITLAILGKPLADGAGDVNDDNVIDIVDWNIIKGCHLDASTCAFKEAADLNDDGNIDGVDLNILLTSLSFKQREGD